MTKLSLPSQVSRAKSDAETVTSSIDERLENPSILLLGADSKTGLEILRRLATHTRRPNIHAFVEDASKFKHGDYQLCTSVVEGSVRHAIDIEEALEETSANWVVLATGNDYMSPEDRRRNRNIRTRTAKNTATVLDLPHLRSVRALVISRIGAGPSSGIKMGLRGRLCKLGNRVLHDYEGLEEALHSIQNRTTVVRTTPIIDSIAPSSYRIVLNNDDNTVPSLSTERSDLASCIVDEIMEQPRNYGSRVVNVTSVWAG